MRDSSFENKLESSSPKDNLCQVWLKMAQWFFRRRFLKVLHVFLLFTNSIISPMRRVWPFIWTNLNPLHPRMLCAKFGWSWTSGSGWRIIFKVFNIFLQFTIIFPLRRAWPFIWTNLNPLHPRMLCAKFGWNWPSGSGEYLEKFFFLIISHFGTGVALHLNKIELPSPRNTLCQVWLKLAQCFWRIRF